MEAALFFVFTLVTVAALLWAGAALLYAEERPLDTRLQQLQASGVASVARTPRRTAGRDPLSLLLYLVSLCGGEGWIRDTDRQLQAAGLRNRRAAAYYILFHLTFFSLLIGGAVYIQQGKSWMQMAVGLIAPAILGYLLPRQVLYRLAARYRNRLQEALPDAVDLLGIVLGTGLALDQAMLRVSEELEYIYPELAAEFSTLVMQVRAGQERSKAFQQMVRRTGLEDIKSLAAMILQSERFGTSLSQAMKVYADALRTRRRLRAEAAVGRAGVKMIFPIVLFILPVLFVVTLVPGILSVLDDLQTLQMRRGG